MDTTHLEKIKCEFSEILHVSRRGENSLDFRRVPVGCVVNALRSEFSDSIAVQIYSIMCPGTTDREQCTA